MQRRVTRSANSRNATSSRVGAATPGDPRPRSSRARLLAGHRWARPCASMAKGPPTPSVSGGWPGQPFPAKRIALRFESLDIRPLSAESRENTSLPDSPSPGSLGPCPSRNASRARDIFSAAQEPSLLATICEPPGEARDAERCCGMQRSADCNVLTAEVLEHDTGPMEADHLACANPRFADWPCATRLGRFDGVAQGRRCGRHQVP